MVINFGDIIGRVHAINALTGFQPRTSLSEGIPKFVAWFRAWNGPG